MLKTMVGLGVLGIPGAFDVLGLVPGVICLCVISTMATWSGYEIGAFKLRHRAVYGIDDAGHLMFGRFGREIFGAAFCLCMFRLPESRGYLLIWDRLDLCRWLRNARDFDFAQCCFDPWYLHCGIRRHCCSCRLLLRQHPDPWSHQVARLGRAGLYRLFE